MPKQIAKAEGVIAPVDTEPIKVAFEIVKLEPYGTKQPLPHFHHNKYRILSPSAPAIVRCRLGLYDPITGKIVRWEGPILNGSQSHRRWAREVIREYIDLTTDDRSVKLCMALFPWE